MNSQIKALDELRREHLLGPISGWTVLWGNYIILGALALAIFLAATVNYPYIITGTGQIKRPTKRGEPYLLDFKVEKKDNHLVKVGQEVFMDLQFSPPSHGSSGKVVARVYSIINTKKQLHFLAIPISTIENIKLLSTGITGKVKITVKNVTLVDRFRGR